MGEGEESPGYLLASAEYNRERPPPVTALELLYPHDSEQVVHFVAEQRQRDTATVRLSPRQRLRHVQRLVQLHARRMWRLERIDDRLDERRTPPLACRPKRFLERRSRLLRLLAPVAE